MTYDKLKGRLLKKDRKYFFRICLESWKSPFIRQNKAFAFILPRHTGGNLRWVIKYGYFVDVKLYHRKFVSGINISCPSASQTATFSKFAQYQPKVQVASKNLI